MWNIMRMMRLSLARDKFLKQNNQNWSLKIGMFIRPKWQGIADITIDAAAKEESVN